MDALIPWRSRILRYGPQAYWTPRSEWWMRPAGGAWRWIAIIRAFSHNELLRWSAMRQPTISRVAMSLTAARYRQPSSVATYVRYCRRIQDAGARVTKRVTRVL